MRASGGEAVAAAALEAASGPPAAGDGEGAAGAQPGEVAILSFARAAVIQLHRRALAGDEAARREILDIWSDYPGRSLECFLCGCVFTLDVVFIFLMPDRAPGRMMGTPLCPDCAAMAELPRWATAIRILKWMWPGAVFDFHMGRR